MAICTECDCDYSDKRAALGYSRCLVCAQKRPEEPPVFIADVSKSNPTVTSKSDALCSLPDVVGYSDRRYGKFMRLASTKGESRSNYKPPVKPH
jgi:hypothetical protein